MIKKIYCIGGANIDRKFISQQPIQLGTSTPVTSFMSLGGVARNVAENLSHWTNNISLLTFIGDDEDGRSIASAMQQLKLTACNCYVIPNMKTANYYALLNPQGELHYAFADMEIYDHLPLHEIHELYQNWYEHSLIFLDTNLPAELITAIKALAKKKHWQLCIDPVSTSKAKKLLPNLNDIFLLKPNQFEAEALTSIKITSPKEAMTAAEKLCMQDITNVVITLGKDGYIIANHHVTKYYPTKKETSYVDANGAGDAFMAGILFGLQQNLSLEEACQIGEKASIAALKTRNSVVP